MISLTGASNSSDGANDSHHPHPPVPALPETSSSSTSESEQAFTTLIEGAVTPSPCITEWTSQSPIDLTMRTIIAIYIIQKEFNLNECRDFHLRTFLARQLFQLLAPLNLPEASLVKCWNAFHSQSLDDVQQKLQAICESAVSAPEELQKQLKLYLGITKLYFPYFDYSIGCLMSGPLTADFEILLEWLENTGFLGSDAFLPIDIKLAFESERDGDGITIQSFQGNVSKRNPPNWKTDLHYLAYGNSTHIQLEAIQKILDSHPMWASLRIFEIAKLFRPQEKHLIASKHFLLRELRQIISLFENDFIVLPRTIKLLRNKPTKGALRWKCIALLSANYTVKERYRQIETLLKKWDPKTNDPELSDLLARELKDFYVALNRKNTLSQSLAKLGQQSQTKNSPKINCVDTCDARIATISKVCEWLAGGLTILARAKSPEETVESIVLDEESADSLDQYMQVRIPIEPTQIQAEIQNFVQEFSETVEIDQPVPTIEEAPSQPSVLSPVTPAQSSTIEELAVTTADQEQIVDISPSISMPSTSCPNWAEVNWVGAWSPKILRPCHHRLRERLGDFQTWPLDQQSIVLKKVCEVRDHLYLSLQGFEILLENLHRGQINQLLICSQQLSSDIYICLEQYLSLEIFCSKKEETNRHGLQSLLRDSELQSHQLTRLAARYNQALMFSRFPIRQTSLFNQNQAPLPQALSHYQFLSQIQEKSSLSQEDHQTCLTIVRETFENIQMLCKVLIGNKSPFKQAEKAKIEEVIAAAQLSSKTAPSAHSIDQFKYLSKIKEMIDLTTMPAVRIALDEAYHWMKAIQAAEMMLREDSDRKATHFYWTRSCLGFDKAAEQIFRAILLSLGLKPPSTHRIDTFLNLVGDACDAATLTMVHRKQLIKMNIGIHHHYLHHQAQTNIQKQYQSCFRGSAKALKDLHAELQKSVEALSALVNAAYRVIVYHTGSSTEVGSSTK